MDITVVELTTVAVFTQLIDTLTAQIELVAGRCLSMTGLTIIIVPVGIGDIFKLDLFVRYPAWYVIGLGQHLLTAYFTRHQPFTAQYNPTKQQEERRPAGKQPLRCVYSA
jgi:hypothetical protein